VALPAAAWPAEGFYLDWGRKLRSRRTVRVLCVLRSRAFDLGVPLLRSRGDVGVSWTHALFPPNLSPGLTVDVLTDPCSMLGRSAGWLADTRDLLPADPTLT
jgi:hypothetical protein